MSRMVYFIRVIFLVLICHQSMAQSWNEITKGSPTPYAQLKSSGFGKVAVDGNHAVIGVVGEGKAYVYEKINGQWSQIAVLTPANAILASRYGCAVDISGSEIIVGANGTSTGGASSGSAYVYKKPAGGWVNMTENAMILASDTKANDWFGSSVSIEDGTAVIGAYSKTVNRNYAGAVYVFVEPSEGWKDTTQTAKLLPDDSQYFGLFGYSVAISQNTIAVGAPRHEIDEGDAGAAYIFEKPTQGWVDTTQTAKLLSSNLALEDEFGYSIDIKDDYVVVGALQTDDTYHGSGSAYVFKKQGSGWANSIEHAKLLASDPWGSVNLGRSVAITDNYIIVGATSGDGLDRNTGVVYVYGKNQNEWVSGTEIAKLSVSDGKSSDHLGYSVAISGNEILAEADLEYSAEPGYIKGAVYSFEKEEDSTWVSGIESQKIISSYKPGNISDFFGLSVSIDGIYAVVGSKGYEEYTGMAYVFQFDGAIWNKVARLTASDKQDGDYFGNSVCISGDYIVVGAVTDDNKVSHSGAAYVFKRPANGWKDTTEIAKLLPSVGNSNQNFGQAVSIEDNLIVVGAKGDNTLFNSGGAAFIYLKPVNEWVNTSSPVAKLLPSVGEAYQQFGSSVSVSGDNVAVGAPGDDEIANGSGAVYVFSKPIGGWTDTTETMKIVSPLVQEYLSLGTSISILGNDLIIGATGWGNSAETARVYVFSTSDGTWESPLKIAELTAEGGHSEDHFGWSVHMNDDLIVVGAGSTSTVGKTGHTYVYNRPDSGWKDMTQTMKIIPSDSANGYNGFGTSVGVSSNKLIVGTIQDNESGFSSGAAYFYDLCIIDTTIEFSGEKLVSKQGNATYQWLDCQNGFDEIDGATEQSFTPSQNGVYTVEVTSNSCVDTSFCLAYLLTTSEEVVKIESDNVYVYPNPATTILNVEVGNNSASIQLTNTIGVVIDSSTGSGLVKFNTENLQSGVYFISVILNDNSNLRVFKVNIR
jgi:hypothetical protein